MKKVLIPLDGSPLAETAVDALDALAPLGPFHVRLVGVVEAAEGLTQVAQEEHLRREEHLLRAYLDGKAADLDGEPSVDSVKGTLLAGRPAEIILAEAAEFFPDLIVISTHGRSGLSRWRAGSVADAVIRSATNNCLVVGPHARLRWPIESVMVSVDGSARSESVLPLAADMATALKATLHVVRVVDLPFSTGEEYQGYLSLMTGHVHDYLKTLRENLEFDGQIVTEARVGSPADRLIDYAAGNDIGLVVLASRGHGGVTRAALGSVAGRLIGAPVPVLIGHTQ